MRRVRLASLNDFAEWQAAARALLLAAVPPEEVRWTDPARAPDMFADDSEAPLVPVLERKVGRVPTRYLKLAKAAICHADSERFATLYSLLWRLQKDRLLLKSRDDPDVSRLHRRVEQVVAEYTRMKAELRFRRAVAADGHKGLMAAFAPRHYVLERVAPHFVSEIRGEDWVITTPYRSAYWDRRELSFGPGRL
jgi:DNA polymerase